MADEAPRSRAARIAAHNALVRVAYHYRGVPEFVVLGGLVPELLCSTAEYKHAGTTDVDVQVNLEIASGAVNGARLEQALQAAGFEPENERVWRWLAEGEQGPRAVVKFELLADLDDQPTEATVHFKNTRHLGAVNLRGTGFASKDTVQRELTGPVDGTEQLVTVNVTGLAGFLLAKTAAARSRHKPKDWYDIAFVLLHNDAGGIAEAAAAVRARFAGELVGTIRTALNELRANFHDEGSQGPAAYVSQMLVDHPELDARTLAADAVLAVNGFYEALFGNE